MKTTAKATRDQEYLVVFPNTITKDLYTKELAASQTPLQRNLSLGKTLVVRLNREQFERVKKAPGTEVYANRWMGLPKGEKARYIHPKTFQKLVPIGRQQHGADKLHDLGVTGKGVTVCVIDTGVEAHKDLSRGRITRFWNVMAKKEVEPFDDHGHGTHCSGIVAAKTGAALGGKIASGVTGMAPEANIIGIKVLDGRGSGTWASVIAGIDKAMELYKEGVRPMVISMSLGGPAQKLDSDPVAKKIDEARALGIVCCVAAGNSGPRKGTIGTPATARKAFAVAALDKNGNVASFSSVGDPTKPDLGQNEKPNIAALGVAVTSLGRGNSYVDMSGTSMAAPHVAGAVALLLGVAKNLADAGKLTVAVDAVPYEELLMASAKNNPDVPAEKEGAGSVQVDKAAELLVQKYSTAVAVVAA